jgi:Holliday junction resolvasome RuvABC endonuclease subunit
MEILRKAVQDNREVFVSVINKTNEELEGRYNSFVEDLEKVVNEVYAMQMKVEDGDHKIKDEAVKLNKAVHDLEAHINTSIITEKSVRKAQDSQLAEELDKLNKKLQVVSEKLQIRMDEEGNQLENQTTKLE